MPTSYAILVRIDKTIDCFTVLELVKIHKNVEMYDEQGEY